MNFWIISMECVIWQNIWDWKVVKEGVLGLDGQGELTLDGDILPLMTEVEVKLYDKEEEQEIWTMTRCGRGKKRILVGIDRSCPLIGMRARMRG